MAHVTFEARSGSNINA